MNKDLFRFCTTAVKWWCNVTIINTSLSFIYYIHTHNMHAVTRTYERFKYIYYLIVCADAVLVLKMTINRIETSTQLIYFYLFNWWNRSVAQWKRARCCISWTRRAKPFLLVCLKVESIQSRKPYCWGNTRWERRVSITSNRETPARKYTQHHNLSHFTMRVVKFKMKSPCPCRDVNFTTARECKKLYGLMIKERWWW